jgi:sugar/nucleoside kinase (ribokinase family)
MTPAPEIIAAGHLCLDIFPHMETVPLASLGTPGKLFETGPMAFSTGGSVGNTGLALHQIGTPVRLMAGVGDDLIGRAVCDVLERYGQGLSDSVRLLPDQPSSYTIVLAPQKVDRIFLHCPGANCTFDSTSVDYELLRGMKLFHLGYPALLPALYADDGAELTAIYRQAKATGVITSMDMALPDPNGPSGQADWAGIFARTLPYVDVFVPSLEESLFCLRRPQYEAWRGALFQQVTLGYLDGLADELLAMGVAIAGFKLGEYGLYLKAADATQLAPLAARLGIDAARWSHARVYHPAFQVEVVGTTGAGDSAYAALLTALLKRLAPDAAAQMACAVGACNVEAADATSGVRSWAATEARLAAGWPLRAERVGG